MLLGGKDQVRLHDADVGFMVFDLPRYLSCGVSVASESSKCLPRVD